MPVRDIATCGTAEANPAGVFATRWIRWPALETGAEYESPPAPQSRPQATKNKMVEPRIPAPATKCAGRDTWDALARRHESSCRQAPPHKARANIPAPG